ncbi:hypothetical protein PIROE2DRAFT_62860 [Piromyces sp. E2]|nr:hypothetical protein PIROE2DRAFT_62860 [Piromyces sp. E2]|eukprot:OUM60904.1 hypothetical protein PIROE2DRAFT_62860 [Piromyces sp. E2]
MENIPGYSLYETVLSSLSILCSFGIKEDYSDELINENWIKLQKQYPYLYDYSTIVEKGDDYSTNVPMKYDLLQRNGQVTDYLNELLESLSEEAIKPERLAKKCSLLAYAKFQLNDTKYTIFSIFTPHSKTDFKSLTYIATSFLNYFENVTTTYPMDNEMEKVLLFCKNNELSIQALLDAAFLKASLELFQNNIKEVDVVNFQITYDQRKFSVKDEKCIGLFAEGTYPYYPIDWVNNSVVDVAKDLTRDIKKNTYLESEEFKRFRIECYYFHKDLYTIEFTFSASNLGKFECLEDLNDNLKNKFVDFYFLGATRMPLPETSRAISIHMFSLFDGSCNISLHYPTVVVPSVYMIKLLGRIKEIMLNNFLPS